MNPFRPFSSVNREQWKHLLFSVLYVILGIGIGLLIGELLCRSSTALQNQIVILLFYLGVFLPGIIEIFSWNRPPPRDPTFMEMVRSKFDGLPFYD